MKLEKGEKLIINAKNGQVILEIDENENITIYAKEELIKKIM